MALIHYEMPTVVPGANLPMAEGSLDPAVQPILKPQDTEPRKRCAHVGIKFIK